MFLARVTVILLLFLCVFCFVFAFRSVLGQNVCVFIPLNFAVRSAFGQRTNFPLHCVMFAVKSVSR